MKTNMVKRKAGRPQAVPENAVPELLRLYDNGPGYRAIARELAKRGVRVDWSAVWRIIKAQRTVDNLEISAKTFLPLF